MRIRTTGRARPSARAVNRRGWVYPAAGALLAVAGAAVLAAQGGVGHVLASAVHSLAIWISEN
jgi:hypothetical protein